MVGHRLSNETQNQFLGFHLNLVPLVHGEQDLQELLAIISRQMMCEKNSFKEVNQVSGILGERGILKFPIIEIIGSKGPITEMLIPILVRGYSGPQKDKPQWNQELPALSPGASGRP